MEDFQALYNRQVNRVYRLALVMLGSQSDAEDMVQTVFLKVWEKKISFRDTDHETAWILTVTKNQCKDVLKSYERKHCSTLEEMPELGIAFENHMENVVWLALESLEPKYRILLYLYYYEGYSIRELTGILKRKESTLQTHGRKTFAAALAGTCVIAVCLLTGVGVNAATDGALLDSIREFCGLPVQQKKAADEGLKLKNEVYAPELAGCSEKYVVFANERALMVYGRQEKKLLAALDLQAMDCNYFNTDSIHTRVLLQKDTIYIFNEKKEQQPTQMYVYDLKKTDASSALSLTEDIRKLERVYLEWKTFSAENSLDTFSGMADGNYWNSLINSGKDGKETGVYSQRCIVWTDRAGRQYRSALVIIGGDDYELYSCPADDTEKISKEKLLVQTYSDEIQTETATEENTQHTGLPEFAYRGDDEIMKLVCDYMIKNRNEHEYLENGGIYIYVPEPVIVKTVRTGNDLFIFGNFWWETYYRNGNTLMSDSGSEMPARLHFVSYGNGSYIFKDKEVAQDGSYYGTSIREFCEGYQVDPQKLMDTAEAHKKIRIKMLRAYVKQNHLDIRYYKDYGWDPVALEK